MRTEAEVVERLRVLRESLEFHRGQVSACMGAIETLEWALVPDEAAEAESAGESEGGA